MTFRRRALALLVAGALTFGLAGCFGQPAAKPSTPAPAFTSDAAAYAAAEKVYREYVDALNQVDLADPKTFEPVFALTTGKLNGQDRKSLTTMHAEGWRVGGETRTLSFTPATWDTTTGEIRAHACSDVSAVSLVDADGTSKVSVDRPPVYSLDLTFIRTPETNGRLLISSSVATMEQSCSTK